MIDYSSVALMLAAPALLRLDGRAGLISRLFAGSYLGVSLLTRMPLGVKPVIPFPVHGQIELASAPALLALPLLSGAFKATRERLYFLSLLATVLTVYSLTDWQADPER